MARIFSPREINWLKKWEVYETSQMKKYGEMPIEYITGWTEFYRRDFIVDQNVLIPRIETEQIVDEVKKILTVKTDSHSASWRIGMTKTVADIGTGCGCIGITLYLELIKLGIRPTIYVSDISKEAVGIAEKNVHSLVLQGVESDCHVGHTSSISRLAKRDPAPQDNDSYPIKLIKSDLFDNYPKNLKFDLIVANLPYIPSSRISKLPESVKDFEPLLALDGGPDGLKLINKLIAQSSSRLKPRGFLLLEIDETQVLSGFHVPRELKIKIIKDQFGKKRFVKINKGDKGY